MDTNTLIVSSIMIKPGSFSLLCDWHFFLLYASRRFLFFSSLCSSVIVISRRFLFFSSLCSSVIDAARNLSRSLLSRRPSWVLFSGSVCFRTNPKTESGTWIKRNFNVATWMSCTKMARWMHRLHKYTSCPYVTICHVAWAKMLKTWKQLTLIGSTWFVNPARVRNWSCAWTDHCPG